VYSFNERAIKSYEKCGFRVEGVLRQEIFRDGSYYDTIAMGILKDEFSKATDGKKSTFQGS
jgi:RimJ/RimL family protein N-acetyltransferase